MRAILSWKSRGCISSARVEGIRGKKSCILKRMSTRRVYHEYDGLTIFIYGIGAYTTLYDFECVSIDGVLRTGIDLSRTSRETYINVFYIWGNEFGSLA